MIKELGAFLNGRTDSIVKKLEDEMKQASSEMKYERAAQIRDQLDAIQRIVEEQRIISTKFADSDVIAMASQENTACIQVFFIRGGKLTGREYFLVEDTDQTADQDLLTEVIKQFYDQAPTIPNQILLPREVEEARIIRQWLKNQRGGKKVELLVPQRGEKKKLVNMAAENATSMLASLKSQEKSEQDRAEGALDDLQTGLDLSSPPMRIECYDISNTQGTALVGKKFCGGDFNGWFCPGRKNPNPGENQIPHFQPYLTWF